MKVPESPPTWQNLVRKGADELIQNVVAAQQSYLVDSKGRYLHWDDQKHRVPPAGLTHQQWWFLTKLARNGSERKLPLLSTSGKAATFVVTAEMNEMLMSIDRRCGVPGPDTEFGASASMLTNSDSDRLLVNALHEESITSSQLEGASTSRKIAKQMLRENRAPKTHSERMIANNFSAMQYIRQDTNAPLSVEQLCEIHRVISNGVLDDPADEGRPQLPGDTRVSIYWQTNGNDQEIYRPPPAEQLPARLETLCSFANEDSDLQTFIHPVLRALIIHFWIGYDHPFADGNGRLARALFYRSMLASGYWLAEFLSISSILRTRPSKYSRSFLLCETDDLDITYFLVDQLQVLVRALSALDAYVARKRADLENLSLLLDGRQDLNKRQLQLLSHALRNPGAEYTIAAHQATHKIVYESARQDLMSLATNAFLERFKSGRTFIFRSPLDLDRRLRP